MSEDKLTDGQCIECSKLTGCPGVMQCDGFVKAPVAPAFIPASEFISECKYDPGSRHYDQGGIETIEIIKAKLTPAQFKGFCLGNIIKYACRANFKGNFGRDVEKAKFYASFIEVK